MTAHAPADPSPATAAAAAPEAILSVRDLRTQFFTRDGIVRAVDGVSLDLKRGETLGIVGESGCGKSVTALSIMRLIPADAGRIVGGSIRFEGAELTTLSERQMRSIRGNRISMIFQEPMTSAEPGADGGDADRRDRCAFTRHLPSRAAWDRAVEMLAIVRIADARQRAARVSAPALRRHAPARDDRHGARLQSPGADRRRADHRAGRHHPGADPEPDAGAQGAARHGHHADHPRSRRGRRNRAAGHRHVCRAEGRGGAGRRSCSAIPCTPTPAA